MKLLLLSRGITNNKIRKETKKLLDQDPKKCKAVVITTKKHKKHILRQTRKLKRELLKVKIKNTDFVHISKKTSYKKFKDYDLMYVGGGNTFYILDALRKSGLDRIISKFAKSGKLYLGASAGALLVCPSIEMAGWSKYIYDDNEINLKNLRGLNIIDCVIMPHVNAGVRRELPGFRKRSKYKIVDITDAQAAVFTGRNKFYKI
ncbi:MAG TPA: Type 1 glutamine amidotransferase-like domain-containing protein [Alphaproteobacteria bacterium]|nr:Type 1 glutamine amidotransferase-like domain-containing protein [Alphaproteobacteria bacterium]